MHHPTINCTHHPMSLTCHAIACTHYDACFCGGAPTIVSSIDDSSTTKTRSECAYLLQGSSQNINFVDYTHFQGKLKFYTPNNKTIQQDIQPRELPSARTFLENTPPCILSFSSFSFFSLREHPSYVPSWNIRLGGAFRDSVYLLRPSHLSDSLPLHITHERNQSEPFFYHTQSSPRFLYASSKDTFFSSGSKGSGFRFSAHHF